MFKKSKTKVLIDDGSEEDDITLNQQPAPKNKDPDGEEEITASKEKGKKAKAKKEKKPIIIEDDEHFLLTGVTPVNRKGSNKKKEEEKSKMYVEKSYCFWETVTMTMKQITPTKKLDKIEGWEPPQVTDVIEEHTARDALTFPTEPSSWPGLEEDTSNYSNLTDPKNSGPKWSTKAKEKLAGMRRRSRGNVSEILEG
ncbi:testis development-related protein [Lepisosteus oculatus]|uniref:Testis development related protein n=1 Tax=Lepisosteus oculatus TaxID=7918 RepID=W5NKZ6_LEPOC|nr:PREDICTED: testis development-related protein [Lepisosteus oculatus]XP_015213787.1 PREDICTED: testis development-related protein [Lepisosteus oculatus]